jgi:hypothetical protein
MRRNERIRLAGIYRRCGALPAPLESRYTGSHRKKVRNVRRRLSEIRKVVDEHASFYPLPIGEGAVRPYTMALPREGWMPWRTDFAEYLWRKCPAVLRAAAVQGVLDLASQLRTNKPAGLAHEMVSVYVEYDGKSFRSADMKLCVDFESARYWGKLDRSRGERVRQGPTLSQRLGLDVPTGFREAGYREPDDDQPGGHRVVWWFWEEDVHAKVLAHVMTGSDEAELQLDWPTNLEV